MRTCPSSASGAAVRFLLSEESSFLTGSEQERVNAMTPDNLSLPPEQDYVTQAGPGYGKMSKVMGESHMVFAP